MFRHSLYYSIKDIYKKEDSNEVVGSVLLTPDGTKTVLEYYKEKYNIDTKVFYHYEIFYEFLFLIGQQYPGNIRKAFILIQAGLHAVPVIYIKEDDEEVLLYADSKGSSSIVNGLVNYWMNKIESTACHFPQPKKPIHLLYCDQPRQADFVSCFIDALVILRDGMRIPDLLKKLNSRKGEKHKSYQNYDYLFQIYPVKLPNELLKTAQLTAFVENNKEDIDRIIYKKEPLSFFRRRYTEEGTFIVNIGGEDKKIENPSNYLRKKGFKLINIIQILVCMKELKEHFENSWNTSMREDFVKKAKKTLEAQADLSECVKLFIKEKEVANSFKRQKT